MKQFDLDSVKLGAVGLAAAASIALPSLSPILLLLVAGFFVVERAVWKQSLPATPANLALGIFAGLVFLNPWLSVRSAVSLPVAMQILVGVCLLFSIRGWAMTARRLHRLLLLLAVLGLILVVIAPFTVDWITDKYGYFSSALYARFTPLSRKVIHPNIIAGAAAVLLVTLTAYLCFTWRALLRWERLLLVAAALSLAFLLVVSQSRGALIAAAAGFVCLFLFALPVRRLGWALVLSFIAVLVLLQFSGAALGLLADSSSSIRGAAGRQEIWEHAGEVIAHYPFTGIGLGNFTAVTDLFYPFLVAGAGQSHAHNLYLQVAADTGLPGLIAWLACLLLVLYCCVQAVRHANGTKGAAASEGSTGFPHTAYAAFGMALLCGQLTMLIHGLSDAPLWATRPAVLVWVLWGMALALPAEPAEFRVP